MQPLIIVFEDSSWANFRPLTTSLPVYELRMGMFNTRERAQLAGELLFSHQKTGGSVKPVLLCRNFLSPLHHGSAGSANPDVLEKGKDKVPFHFWINGRSRGSIAEISALLKNDGLPVGACISDEQGLVAAKMAPEHSLKLYEQWQKWCAVKPAEYESKPATFNWEAVLTQTSDLILPALNAIWELAPNISKILENDAEFLEECAQFKRTPFGLFPSKDNSTPFWLKESNFKLSSGFSEEGNVWLAEEVQIAKSAVLDASKGPIIIDREVNIMPHCFLEGPLYIGCGSTFKAGATIYGESSFGIGNRMAGEIGESSFGDFANKQHDGFIGHAAIGSWTNLGAMTTCSDLKNNYGNVRINIGSGTVNTRQRFVGLLMGDHAKTAIGTMFNTGTCIGFSSNIFGGEMPAKHVGNFSWGGLGDSAIYEKARAVDTARIVMGRRGCELSEEVEKLFNYIF
ncbi:MAG: hypothetical protein GY780_17890 [bacterium]|nr:hypothetical protein [bacterium]